MFWGILRMCECLGSLIILNAYFDIIRYIFKYYSTTT